MKQIGRKPPTPNRRLNVARTRNPKARAQTGTRAQTSKRAGPAEETTEAPSPKPQRAGARSVHRRRRMLL